MKILVDLNINEKITMIMVTHDAALKAFAHRVVKMSDGKVLKIIECDNTQRQETIDALNARILKGKVDGQVSVREGIQQDNDNNKRFEVRSIPQNFKVLVSNPSEKTSVRKP